MDQQHQSNPTNNEQEVNKTNTTTHRPTFGQPPYSKQHQKINLQTHSPTNVHNANLPHQISVNEHQQHLQINTSPYMTSPQHTTTLLPTNNHPPSHTINYLFNQLRTASHPPPSTTTSTTKTVAKSMFFKPPTQHLATTKANSEDDGDQS